MLLRQRLRPGCAAHLTHQPEVQQFDHGGLDDVPADKHVARLHIAVDQADAMRLVQRPAQLPGAQPWGGLVGTVSPSKRTGLYTC